ncbi:cyclodeaminase/cyclohydrolase family protein [Facklamia hominis]|uniref:cyclodeaminase/cyclohydrolase family protein n=1 Tax=Facklamia hominis TaxID=178214 RepID=UPI0029D414A7|nr:cyclodeaminase/cyclohydrolase family protein [Facklamia hominis]WPJ91172.1 cyclodeaminase/cyclohydrolase family protein [Facklamia hominis]
MKELKITEFVNQLASDQPTPGGGAAAGVSASMGIGAILMAMIFSKTKKMSEAEHQYLLDRIEEFESIKLKFLEIIDRDASEFEPLSRAYGMPRETDSEKEARQAAIQEGLVIASQPPLDLIKETEKVLKDFDAILPLIKKMIISDVGVGLQLLRSTLHSSRLNLYINGSSITDEAIKAEYIALADEKIPALSDQIDRYYDQVKDVLK